MIAAAIAVAAVPRGAAAAPEMPQPTYDNTLYAFVYDAPIDTDETYAASRDALLAKVAPGPYARVGFTTYHAIDMPWNADLLNPVLTLPTAAALEDILSRLEGDGLVYHASTMLGMSRFQWIYETAKRQDRRNAQWYSDNLIAAPGTAAATAATNAWATPSRYARKLRRHMEAKVRAFARLFSQLDGAHPGTLISASGDAEAELNEGRAVEGLPKDAQIIADYSPFAILEFRDWLLHTGLYADDGPYAGQGYKKKRTETYAQGATALTPENLALFNATYKTSFTSWSLEYFRWNLSEPIDGDPKAIKFNKYKKPTFAPLPTSGGSYLPGGFDAPRSKRDPTPKWWKLWLKFRTQMVKNFARDVASWMTQPAQPGDAAIAPERWYSHQIPGDYLFGRYPGGPNPHLRLHTSASPMSTALLRADLGSPGLTMLDRYELGIFGPPGGYNRTTQYLLDAMEAKRLPNWGIPEYAPSWHIDVGPDLNLGRIKAQWHRAFAAGAHMMAYTPWPHFTDTLNGNALGQFLLEVGDAPRAPLYWPADRAAFVRQIYLDLLHREPTTSESNARVGAIFDGTVPRPQLVVEIIGSTDAGNTAAALARFYLGLLGRTPDLAGFQSWMGFLSTAGCSPSCLETRRQQIVDSMATTSEFRNRFGGANPTPETFVTKLFQQLLGRTPTAGEAAPWIGEISAGRLTRAQTARLFAEGAEYANRSDLATFVVLSYYGVLRRMPTNGERTEWRNRLNDGLSKRSLVQVFLTSPEYTARFGA